MSQLTVSEKLAVAQRADHLAAAKEALALATAGSGSGGRKGSPKGSPPSPPALTVARHVTASARALGFFSIGLKAKGRSAPVNPEGAASGGAKKHSINAAEVEMIKGRMHELDQAAHGDSSSHSDGRRDGRHNGRFLRLNSGSPQQRLGRCYLAASAWCHALEAKAWFNNSITLAIIVASVMVGLGTEPRFSAMAWMQRLESAILAVFIAECVVKIVARGAAPLDYFRDAWNLFDFVIVAASIAPMFLSVGGFEGIVAVFRLLRLLRIFKLAKQLKQLRIIVEALIKGFSSITYISLILFLFFYVFAIVAMLLFKDNDPVHFGTLHIALFSLFRASTMEDWTDLM